MRYEYNFDTDKLDLVNDNVSITAGSNIDVSGTFPNFTISVSGISATNFVEVNNILANQVFQ